MGTSRWTSGCILDNNARHDDEHDAGPGHDAEYNSRRSAGLDMILDLDLVLDMTLDLMPDIGHVSSNYWKIRASFDYSLSTQPPLSHLIQYGEHLLI